MVCFNICHWNPTLALQPEQGVIKLIVQVPTHFFISDNNPPFTHKIHSALNDVKTIGIIQWSTSGSTRQKQFIFFHRKPISRTNHNHEGETLKPSCRLRSMTTRMWSNNKDTKHICLVTHITCHDKQTTFRVLPAFSIKLKKLGVLKMLRAEHSTTAITHAYLF